MEDVYPKGGVCNSCILVVSRHAYRSSAIVKYREFTSILIKAKIMGLSTPGTVNLTAKYHIGVSS